jgi:hypothetical protein
MWGFVSSSRNGEENKKNESKKGGLTCRKQSQDPSAPGPISQHTCCLYIVLENRIVNKSPGLGPSWAGKTGAGGAAIGASIGP